MNDTYNCHIVKDDSIFSHKTGTLEGVTYDDLVITLGEPNCGFGKARWSWGFRVLPSESPMALWDWKGSGDRDCWSIYGNCDTWRKLFPEATIKSELA